MSRSCSFDPLRRYATPAQNGAGLRLQRSGSTTVAKLSISDAARRAGVERSTIYRRAQRGEISLEKGPGGKPRVDLSELLRVYPDADQSPQPATVVHARSGQRMRHASESKALEREVELLRQQVTMLQADKEDLRRRLDRAEEDRTIALRLLEGRRPSDEGMVGRNHRSQGLLAQLWSRLFGSRG